ncbi:hypothetical protein [Chryseolinea soli]|uniref:Uncharacterized protein n=1 Tax=Chryseolinea soli TaxID=2321403 RepID=A0A385SIY2_9BACT|nr:hypothetical protein [Chryseolinea soli]AYB30331.1 hypothetical protein D4L85_06890 [Chryseolinea soli]
MTVLFYYRRQEICHNVLWVFVLYRSSWTNGVGTYFYKSYEMGKSFRPDSDPHASSLLPPIGQKWNIVTSNQLTARYFKGAVPGGTFGGGGVLNDLMAILGFILKRKEGGYREKKRDCLASVQS